MKVDVRVLAATNRDLKKAMKSGRFRRDLFYRLGVVSLHIPPLRERKEDLRPLLECLFRRYAQLYNRPDLTGPDEGLLEAAQSWSWPGNIRELENVVKRAILLGEVDRSIQEDEPESQGIGSTNEKGADVTAAEEGTLSLHEVGRRALQLAERRTIIRALEHRNWNRRRAARDLKVSYRSLLYKIKDYTLSPDSPASEDDH